MALLTEARESAPRAASPPRWGLVDVVALAVSAALGLFVFFWRLTTPSIVNDELIYRAAADQYVRGIYELTNQHPPLAKFLIGASHTLLGGDLFADRFAGALLGFLTGFLVAAAAYVVTRRPRAAVAAGALWWLLPIAPGVIQLHVARMVTLEAPMLFFVAATVLAATVTVRRPVLRWWLITGALAGLAASSKLTGVVAVAALLPVAVQQRHELRRTLQHTAAASAAFFTCFLLPYVPMGRQAPEVLREAFVFQLGHARDGHVQIVAGQLYDHQPWWSPFWFQAQYLGWPALVALFALAGLGLVLLRRRPELWPAAAVLGLGLLLVCSSPIKLPQYQDVWMPSLCVLAGAAVAAPARRVTAGLRLLLLVPLLVAAVVQVADVADEGVEDYRAAGQLLDERVPPTELLTIWGDSGALREVAPENPLTRELPPDGRPAVLIVDPTIADRQPAEDVDAWLARYGAGYEAYEYQRLTVYLRP